MPRLCDDYGVGGAPGHARLAEVIEPAIHDAYVDIGKRRLGESLHPLVPRLAHTRARLDADESLEVESGILGRRGVQEEAAEDARSRSGLDDGRLRRSHHVVDVRQRAGRVRGPCAVVLPSTAGWLEGAHKFIRAGCEAFGGDVVDVGCLCHSQERRDEAGVPKNHGVRSE